MYGEDFVLNAESILDRAAKILNTKSDRQTALALDVKPQTFANWKSRDSLPWERLYRLSIDRGINFHWLITGEGPMSEDDGESEFAPIPKHRARLSGGGGSWAFADAGEVDYHVAFRRDWLSKVGPINRLVALEVEGDSMSPTIGNRDLVLVDTSKNRVSDVLSGKIYAFSDDIVGGEALLKVKRLFLEPGSILVRSDNTAEGHRDYTITDLSTITIIGRVVWVGKEL